MRSALKQILKFIIALLALTASLIGCSPGAGSPDPVPEPVPPAPSNPVPAPPDPTEYVVPCDAEFPLPLEFIHETAAEVAASSGLAGCASQDGQRTHIVNGSCYVWVAPDFHWTSQSSKLKAQAFRDGVATLMTGLAIEPGAEAEIEVAPEDLYVTVNEQAQGAWEAVVLASFVAEDRLTSAVTDEISGNSKTRAALAECAAAGYGAAKYVAEATDATSAFDEFLSKLGLATGAVACTNAIDEYVRSARPTEVVTVQTVDDLLAHAHSPGFSAVHLESLHKSALARVAIQTRRILSIVRIP